MKRDSNHPTGEGHSSGQRGVDKVYLTSNQVRRRYGDITSMTLYRWGKREELRFPKPMYRNGRRYWRLADLEEWEASEDDEDEPEEPPDSFRRPRHTCFSRYTARSRRFPRMCIGMCHPIQSTRN